MEEKLKPYFDDITTCLNNEWPEIREDVEKHFVDFYDWYSFWMQDDEVLLAKVAEDFNLKSRIDCKLLICQIIEQHRKLNNKS